MHLLPRLYAIARLIPLGSRVADVGTDHGYLPVWLIAEGICPFVVATDVASGPLETAKRSAARMGLVPGPDFRLADGLDAISPQEVDTVVMAGMGGETIQGMIGRAPWLRAGAHRMVLQPQSKIPELVDFLANAGYRIEDQHLVEEAGRIYTIFEVTPGVMEPPAGGLRYVTRSLLERGDPLLGPYLAGIADKLRRAIQGLEQAENGAEKRMEFARALAELEQWRGV